jgi:hypothetical protein
MPRGSIISVKMGGIYYKLSEHNRSEFGMNENRIEKAQRMANGTLRKYWVADKKSFTLSWDMLPGTSAYTVDGAWGAEQIRDFYKTSEGRGTFQIKINLAKDGLDQTDAGYEEYTVSITNASFNVQKRGIQPHYAVSLSMEQV